MARRKRGNLWGAAQSSSRGGRRTSLLMGAIPEVKVAVGSRLTVDGQEVKVTSIRRAGQKFSIVCSPIEVDGGSQR